MHHVKYLNRCVLIRNRNLLQVHLDRLDRGHTRQVVGFVAVVVHAIICPGEAQRTATRGIADIPYFDSSFRTPTYERAFIAYERKIPNGICMADELAVKSRGVERSICSMS